MVIIISSVQDHFAYYDNLGHLRNGRENDGIAFQGLVDNYAPEGFVFNSNRIYDFTRSAKAKVREEVVAYLNGVLPGLQEDCGKLREAFDCLFDYYKYKAYLSIVGQQRRESMKMFVFDDQDEHRYVAHINFSSTTTRDAANQFTVHATLTCQRYTYFALQQTDFEEVLQALQNLHVN